MDQNAGESPPAANCALQEALKAWEVGLNNTLSRLAPPTAGYSSHAPTCETALQANPVEEQTRLTIKHQLGSLEGQLSASCALGTDAGTQTNYKCTRLEVALKKFEESIQRAQACISEPTVALKLAQIQAQHKELDVACRELVFWEGERRNQALRQSLAVPNKGSLGVSEEVLQAVIDSVSSQSGAQLRQVIADQAREVPGQQTTINGEKLFPFLLPGEESDLKQTIEQPPAPISSSYLLSMLLKHRPTGIENTVPALSTYLLSMIQLLSTKEKLGGFAGLEFSVMSQDAMNENYQIKAYHFQLNSQSSELNVKMNYRAVHNKMVPETGSFESCALHGEKEGSFILGPDGRITLSETQPVMSTSIDAPGPAEDSSESSKGSNASSATQEAHKALVTETQRAYQDIQECELLRMALIPLAHHIMFASLTVKELKSWLVHFPENGILQRRALLDTLFSQGNSRRLFLAARTAQDDAAMPEDGSASLFSLLIGLWTAYNDPTLSDLKNPSPLPGVALKGNEALSAAFQAVQNQYQALTADLGKDEVQSFLSSVSKLRKAIADNKAGSLGDCLNPEVNDALYRKATRVYDGTNSETSDAIFAYDCRIENHYPLRDIACFNYLLALEDAAFFGLQDAASNAVVDLNTEQLKQRLALATTKPARQAFFKALLVPNTPAVFEKMIALFNADSLLPISSPTAKSGYEEEQKQTCISALQTHLENQPGAWDAFFQACQNNPGHFKTLLDWCNTHKDLVAPLRQAILQRVNDDAAQLQNFSTLMGEWYLKHYQEKERASEASASGVGQISASNRWVAHPVLLETLKDLGKKQVAKKPMSVMQSRGQQMLNEVGGLTAMYQSVKNAPALTSALETLQQGNAIATASAGPEADSDSPTAVSEEEDKALRLLCAVKKAISPSAQNRSEVSLSEQEQAFIAALRSNEKVMEMLRLMILGTWWGSRDAATDCRRFILLLAACKRAYCPATQTTAPPSLDLNRLHREILALRDANHPDFHRRSKGLYPLTRWGGRSKKIWEIADKLPGDGAPTLQPHI